MVQVDRDTSVREEGLAVTGVLSRSMDAPPQTTHLRGQRAHGVLPARRTRFSSIYPGVVFTVLAWTLLTSAFSYYLSNFAAYASYYAGMAGIIAALYFLYLAALVLIFGGELNRAIRIRRLSRAMRGEV